MSRVLILGNRYQFNTKEKKFIENNIQKLFSLNINQGTTESEKNVDNINHFVQKENISHIVLNFEKKISLNLKNYLEKLEYQGIHLLTYSDFLECFVTKGL